MFDVGSAGYKMNEFKQELYDKSGIGIPHEDVETNDVAIFGWDIFSHLLLINVYVWKWMSYFSKLSLLRKKCIRENT